MTKAYLITAYQDPEHLKRLINSLDDEKSYFYIHIDNKVNVDVFTEVIKGANIKFLDHRFNIYWGSFSQVQSIISLLKEVISDDRFFNRITLISGQDYPIFSKSKIDTLFTESLETQFLIGYNITNGNSRGQLNKIRKYWFHNISNIWFKRIVKYLMCLIPIRKPSKVFFNNKLNNIYFGSDYWSLTYDCAVYVYETFSKEKALQKYLKYAFAPSELFVQTIVFNSPYAKDAILFDSLDYQGLAKLTPLHYIEYGKMIKIFEEPDYDTLIGSSKMFFRKATTEKSTKLLDKIDRYRNYDKGSMI